MTRINKVRPAIWLAITAATWWVVESSVAVRPLWRISEDSPQAVVGFTADSRTLFTIASHPTYGTHTTTGPVSIWDAASGRLRSQLFEDGRRISALGVSPDGAYLATIEYHDGITEYVIWDVANRQIWGKIPVVEDKNKARWDQFTFSPDGQVLALSTERDGKSRVILWNLRDRREQATLDGDTPFAFSPDGRLIAMGDSRHAVNARPELALAPGTVRIWDVATARVVERYDGLQRPAYRLTFSPDGRHLVASIPLEGKNPEFQVLFAVAPLRPIATLTNCIWPVFHDGGRLLVVYGTGAMRTDHEFQHYDTATGQLLATYRHDKQDSTGGGLVGRLGEREYGIIQRRDAEPNVFYRTLGRLPYFGQLGKPVQENVLRTFRTDTGTECQSIISRHGGMESDISPDCRLLAMTTFARRADWSDHTVSVWDMPPRKNRIHVGIITASIVAAMWGLSTYGRQIAVMRSSRPDGSGCRNVQTRDETG